MKPVKIDRIDRIKMSLLVLALVFSAAPAATQNYCEAACDSSRGCTGGCSISLGECGVLCTSYPCQANCKGVGPMGCRDIGATIQCSSYSSPLSAGPMQDLPQVPGQPGVLARALEPGFSGWAVVEHRPLTDAAPHAGFLGVVASSSDLFGDLAIEKAFGMVEEEARYRAAARAAEREERFEPKAGQGERLDAGQPFVHLYVAPKGACLTAETRWENAQVPEAIGRGVGAYVRGRTDGSGAIESLDLLYTRYPDQAAALVDYALSSLRVEAREQPGVPVELYGYIGVFRDGRPGYLVVAVTPSE